MNDLANLIQCPTNSYVNLLYLKDCVSHQSSFHEHPKINLTKNDIMVTYS